MGLGGKIKGAAIDAYLGRGPTFKRRWHGLKRTLSGGERVVKFYYQADDPYSHLLAQALRTVVRSFDIRLQPIVVPPPAADADPEPQKRLAAAMRDAAEVAAHLSVDFPMHASVPAADRVRRVNAVLLEDRPADAWLDAAVRLGAALWRDDADSLAAAVRELGTVAGQSVRPTLEANYQALRKARHYMAGMLEYGGEWYWGIDRLPYLVARLVSEGAGEAFEPVTEVEAPFPSATLVDGRVGVKCFFSFRSPYSYLAITRLQQLRDVLPMTLELAPVLPMVMRGLPVPKDKVLYIARDAKREADRLGIPYGRMHDPLGVGVERCLALFCHVQREHGERAAHDFAVAAYHGIWSKAIDVASDAGLAEVAGEHRDLIDVALGDERWRAQVEANRVDLTELGLWGVPCFQIGEWSTWGQDRLWLVEKRVLASQPAL